MDEQIARALCKACGRDPDAILNGVPEWVARQVEARAAHSVMAGKVAELEGALQEAEPLVETLHSIVNAKSSRAVVWRCLKRIRAALAHPKGME